MNDYRYNDEQKKTDTKENSLYDSIYRLFKKRQN